MNTEVKSVTLLKETASREDPDVHEETIIRFKNARRPRKAAIMKVMTDSKQSLVGDYSCCSRMP